MSTPIAQGSSLLQELAPLVRQAIETLRARLQQLPQADYGAIVCHGGGMFSRTVFLKKGQVLVGKIHRVEHLNIMSSGDISVATEDGARRLTGFHVMACRPGSRRVGVVHEDTVWTTILRTDETDLAQVEQLYFAPNHQDLESLATSLETLWPLSIPS